MGQAVAHFEILGKDQEKLKKYYSELFGWQIDSDNPMKYGMVTRETTSEGVGIAGGIGAAPEGHPGHVTFYVEVPDVAGALEKAESLGGKRAMGPEQVPGGPEIGLFTDPEGHLIGVVKSA